MRDTLPALPWIRELARPYLRGYRARLARSGSLRGYWFNAPGATRSRRGFFVGYLTSAEGYEFLAPQPPECVVFAFVEPAGGRAHQRLVSDSDALLRRTFDYIRWLTHRHPRFVFHGDQAAALARHLSMHEWPRGMHEHLSRNFFIETLAWLVRSGLVRKLAARPGGTAGPKIRPARRSKSRST